MIFKKLKMLFKRKEYSGKKSYRDQLDAYFKFHKKYYKDDPNIYDTKYESIINVGETIYNSFSNIEMKVSYTFDTDLEIEMSIGNTGQVRNRDPSLWLQSFPLITVTIYYDEDDNEISFLVFHDSNPFDDAINSTRYARTFSFAQKDECIAYIKEALNELEKVKQNLD